MGNTKMGSTNGEQLKDAEFYAEGLASEVSHCKRAVPSKCLSESRQIAG